MHIRDCTPDDNAWILDCARKAYAGLIDGWHDEGAAAWIDACVRSNSTITMRGDGVVGFADVMAFPWAPRELECDLMHLFGAASDPAGREALSVVAAIQKRSEQMGCARLYISSIFADLTPIGRRLGGRPFRPVYIVEASRVH